jgi:RNA polymerase sigma-70 factor, ECF subfamily
VNENQWLADRFEEHRPQLRTVAYRMLGSLSEADDAVQDTWLRVSRAETAEVENLGGWMTTIVARVCLNMLRSRRRRREDGLDHLPDPVVSAEDQLEPEHEAILADSVGIALQVVLDTLSPSERLAFVLHDLFAVPFEEIGPLVERSPEAARQLASRARRRVRGADVRSPEDPARQREVVNAFFRASREGDLAGLMELLDPDIVLRADQGAGRGGFMVIRGAEAVSHRAHATPGTVVLPALVNGSAGAVITRNGEPLAILAFTVIAGRIVEIDAYGDPDRVRRVAGAALTASH